MKTTIALSLTTLLVSAALAQSTPPAPPTPPPAGTPGPEAKPPDQPAPEQTTYTGVVDGGVQGVSNNTGSARFQEYRDVPDGGVLPFLRLRTGLTGYSLDITAENTARTDQHYFIRADSDLLRVTGDFNQIPHRFGVGHSLEQQVSKSSFQISDTLQRAFQTALEQQAATNKNAIAFPFLSNLVAPSLATANPIDLELLRKRGFVDFNIFPNAPTNTHVTYFAESRSGNRAAGTSFGFGNVVETPEPVNYRTTDVGITTEMPMTRGLVRAGLRMNQFRDEVNSYTFDNPFRVVNSTDASAYTGPGAGSINGPAVGRIAAPPDNQALNASIGGIYKLPLSSRFTADLNLGRWKQNDQFMPMTTNTAIVVPINASDINVLPQRSLNGKVNTTAANLQFTSSPIKNLDLAARWRFYDFDNRTSRISFPGYVRFDATWEDIARISVPYSYRRNRGDLTADYKLGTMANLEAGFRSETRHHDFREVDRDTENVWRIGGDIRPRNWITLRTSFEFGDRSINGYDPENAEASFRDPQAPVQPPTLRRFDINARHVDRVVSMLQVTPFGGNLAFDVNYLHNLDRYKDAQFGLQRWRNDSFNVEANYAPSDRWNALAFYSNELLGGIQIDEQNSNGVLSLDPRNDWVANNTDRVNTLGAGFNLGIVPQKIDLRLVARYQRANGNAQLTPLVTPSNLNPRSIPNFDDTKLWNASAELTYHIVQTVDLAAGVWVEKYDLNDAESSSLPNYVPGSFFLSPNFQDYRGNVAYVRASYHW